MPGDNTLELVQAVYATGWAFQRRYLKGEVKVDRIDDGTEKIIHLVKYQVDNWPGFKPSRRLSVKLTRSLVDVELPANISTLPDATVNVLKNINEKVTVEAVWEENFTLDSAEEFVAAMLPKFAALANFIYAGYCEELQELEQ